MTLDQETRRGEYAISTDPALIDVAYVHAFLTESYWAGGIPRSLVEAGIAGALCFGVYDSQGQVGFARVITDYATFAYLADLFVDEKCRGRGLSKWLMGVVLAHPRLQNLRRWMLATRDAHGLYSQFGFQAPEEPGRFMVISKPNIYRTDPHFRGLS